MELSILYIEFKSGGLFAYRDVDYEAYDEFINAGSVGSHFFARIKGKFDCEKVEREEKE